MATQVRSKPGNKAPVTKHPLFPAVVALWFGALFGLGSLAVRSSLIESAVLSLSLDVLLPAAAPPLGMKARMIMALLMAAVGIALGAMVARRIARPKPVNQPRRRDAGSKFSNRQARAEAAAASLSQPPAASGRRRALTIENEAEADFQFDTVPLPGAPPHILDVTQMDLAPHEEAIPVESHVQPESVQPAAAQAEPALDLGHFAEAELQPVAPAPAPEPQIAAPTSMSLERFEPQIEAQPEAPRQEFRPTGLVQDLAPAKEVNQPPADAQQFGRPFDSAPQLAEDPLDLGAEQMLGEEAPAMVESESDEYARVMAGLRQAEGVTPRGEPRQWSGEAPVAAAQAAWSAEPPVTAVQEPRQWADPAPVAAEPAAEEASHELPVFAPPAPVAAATASSRLTSAELAELSSVELIERLALALRQRSHQGPAPATLADAAASLAAPGPGFTPLAGLAAESLPGLTKPFDAPQAPAPGPVPTSLDLPRFDRPSPVAPVEAAPTDPAATSRMELPAALRPIDFNDYADQDDPGEPALPPRSFAPPAEAKLALDPRASEPAPVAYAPPQAVSEEADAEADVAESNYSSLLELGRTAAMRQDFVRIEEPPADDDGTIEPVVIFPGHSARPGTRFAAPDQQADAAPLAASQLAAVEAGTQPVRRFDAPAALAAPAPAAVPGGLRQDPEETERALRSALATLQRMSGAA